MLISLQFQHHILLTITTSTSYFVDNYYFNIKFCWQLLFQHGILLTITVSTSHFVDNYYFNIIFMVITIFQHQILLIIIQTIIYHLNDLILITNGNFNFCNPLLKNILFSFSLHKSELFLFSNCKCKPFLHHSNVKGIYIKIIIMKNNFQFFFFFL